LYICLFAGVSLGLVSQGVPVLGVIASPKLPYRWADRADPAAQRGCVFVGVVNRGAYTSALRLDEDHSSQSQPEYRLQATNASSSSPDAIQVIESMEGHHPKLESARIVREIGATRAPIRMDSASKYAMVSRWYGWHVFFFSGDAC
jgi:3'-phosphoadenosine 5'-phosphosulfate (PAPS) 3'-phosphatase